jgi:hypothetical protein
VRRKNESAPDAQAGSMLPGLSSWLSTLELEPGPYVLHILDQRLAEGGLILIGVSFTVEHPPSAKQIRESLRFEYPKGSSLTCADGPRTVSATPSSGKENLSGLDLKKPFAELAKTQGWRVLPRTFCVTRPAHG